MTQRFPPALAGQVNTAINLLVFVAAFAVQWGMGAIIGLWPPASPGVSAEAGYRAAFGVMLAAEMAGLAWYFVYRRSAVPAG